MQPLLTRRSAAQAAAHASRAATQAADHYRGACRSRSDAEFGARMESALDQLEETTFWLELLRLTDAAPAETINPLIADGRDLSVMLRSETVAPRRG
jgi:four helix bundle protein